ncbi:MAG TPA: CAP domain-containing protein [Thermoanaerobaculia bacterium]|nr:CAP domain-containing protein [Thermoanaerobaculia bacterium]
MSIEASSHARINASRREVGAPDLLLDPVLTEVARRYSERMRDEGFFGHQDPDGGGLASRLRAVGVSFSLAGENLAHVSGADDPAALAHQMLMGNEEHRANILDARFTEVGIGVAQRGDTYWMTQIFLRP